MNELLLTAVQLQPAVVVTVTLAEPPAAAKLALVGLIEKNKCLRNPRVRPLRQYELCLVTDCRHAHAMTCKHCPDRAAICSAIQVLIGLKDTVACVQE